jgi:hypothetical protein
VTALAVQTKAAAGSNTTTPATVGVAASAASAGAVKASEGLGCNEIVLCEETQLRLAIEDACNSVMTKCQKHLMFAMKLISALAGNSLAISSLK